MGDSKSPISLTANRESGGTNPRAWQGCHEPLLIRGLRAVGSPTASQRRTQCCVRAPPGCRRWRSPPKAYGPFPRISQGEGASLPGPANRGNPRKAQESPRKTPGKPLRPIAHRTRFVFLPCPLTRLTHHHVPIHIHKRLPLALLTRRFTRDMPAAATPPATHRASASSTICPAAAACSTQTLCSSRA